MSKAKIQAKLQARDANFPQEWLVPKDQLPTDLNVIHFIQNSNLLSQKEFEITESTVTQLLSKIKSKEYTSLQVTRAFAHRATIAHQLTNCLTEVFFQDAFAQAQELDDYYNQTGELKGVLHGLPISLKDEFNVIGQYSTLGLVKYLDNEKLTHDSPNVEILRNQGAVFYVKTNVPSGVFNNVSENNVFGKTVSPFNTSLSSGGSSGGEGALVALKGSPLGVGSDMGGSVRQPASLQNLFGFKPSSQRTPHDTTSIVKGLESIVATNGVLGTDYVSNELYLKTIVDSQSWLTNSKVVPLPWRPVNLIGKKLKFGILLDDGIIRPTPPVKRALEHVRDELIKQGHEVIEWNSELIAPIAGYSAFMFSNGAKTLTQALYDGDEKIPMLRFLETVSDLQVSELWKLQYERTLNTNKFWSKWTELGIDGLITPVSPLAGTTFDGFVDVSYSPLANVLDTPSGTFPVLEVDAKLDSKNVDDLGPRNKQERKVHESYDIEKIKGAVVGLQVLGRRLEEEKVLELVKVISKSIGTFDYWDLQKGKSKI